MIYLLLYPMERGANALRVELLGKGNRSPGERGRKRFVGTTPSLSVSTFFSSLSRCVSNADKRAYGTGDIPRRFKRLLVLQATSA